MFLENQNKLKLFLAAVCFFSTVASSKPPEVKKTAPQKPWEPTWSTELTFTSEAQWNADYGPDGDDPKADENYEALEKFYDLAWEKLAKRPDIKSVEYKEQGDKWGVDMVRVTYKDGWSFDITLDPGVLEVILKPYNFDDLKNTHAERVDKDIFGIMKEAGLEPRYKGEDAGGGHIHVGMLSAFKTNDVLFFRNLMVDFANHPEVGNGAFENDKDNAKPFMDLTKGQKKKFGKWVREVDEGHFGTVREAATRLVADVLFDGRPATGEEIMKAKYWGINLLRMAYLDTNKTLWKNEDARFETWNDYWASEIFDDTERKARTLEYRFIRAHQSAEEVVKTTELLKERMRLMKEKGRPIPLHPQFIEGKNPSIEERAKLFYRFIKETGLNPLDYVFLLPQSRIEDKEWRKWHRTFIAEANQNGIFEDSKAKKLNCTHLLAKTAALPTKISVSK